MDSVALGPFRAFASNYFNQYDESLKISKKKKFSKIVKKASVVVEDINDSLKQGRDHLLTIIRSQFNQFRFELEFGFSLLFYGLGSKIEPIEEFCIHGLPDCPIIIVDALSYKFNSLEFGMQLKTHLTGRAPTKDIEADALYSSLCDDLSSSSKRTALLFCGLDRVHSEDLKLISMIAQEESLFFISMIENLDFIPQFIDARLQKRFNFVFHDITTFMPYNYELGALADMANSKENSVELQKKSLETVKYVLSSLPAKSLKLLKHILDAQLKGKALTRAQTSNLAIDNFIISSETGLMPLLNEFLDHQILQITEEDLLVVLLDEEDLPKLRELL